MRQALELYGVHALDEGAGWARIVDSQVCPFTDRRCIKVRKSQPEITIGTCTVSHARGNSKVMICPNGLLEDNKVFLDCIHLLTLHEPGNKFHLVPEVSIPGGSIDYFLASTRHGKVVDFVAIEIQTLDTTGTVWPARQKVLWEKGLHVEHDAEDSRGYGINWKMTAKTVLIQLNHKIQTLESLNKRLVLVIQNQLFDYMQREFRFDHIGDARLGDSAHIHVYSLEERSPESLRLNLSSRLSTDADGVVASLGLRADPNVALSQLTGRLESRLSGASLLKVV